MNTAVSFRPSTASLLECLQPAIDGHFGASIAAITRTPSRYSTSFAIEDLGLTLSDGSSIAVVFKNLSPEAMLEEARRTRPELIYDPLREIEVYRSLLAPADLGTARLFGTEADAAEQRFWLFIEKVDGVELYQVESLEVWKGASRWLRHMHHRLAPDRHQIPSLIRCDAAWYRAWMRRAVDFASGRSYSGLEQLASIHEKVVEHLCEMPETVIHGDLYASNVLVDQSEDGLRVCPVDWERASVGPGLIDLATLSMGWDEDAVSQLALAYTGSDSDLISLAFCRLQLCIQWLGWSPAWRPPPEHRRDWLNDALALADELGL